jgi:hypothetical protein
MGSVKISMETLEKRLDIHFEIAYLWNQNIAQSNTKQGGCDEQRIDSKLE